METGLGVAAELRDAGRVATRGAHRRAILQESPHAELTSLADGPMDPVIGEQSLFVDS